MEKPLTVAYADFNRQLTELINTSGLPAFVILASLKSLIGELDKIAGQQYQHDLQAFQTKKEQIVQDKEVPKEEF